MAAFTAKCLRRRGLLEEADDEAVAASKLRARLVVAMAASAQ